MTEHELAEALRARMRELRKDYPDILAKMETVPDRRLIEGHVRCAACGRFHTTPEDFLALADKHTELVPFLEASQAIVLRSWPKACLRKLDKIEQAIRTGRH